MTLVLLFGGCLLLLVLVSGTAARSVLSTSLIFLVAGAFAARLGWVSLRPDSAVVDSVVALALFTVLFIDGAALGRSDVRGRWPLVIRGVALGLVISLAGVALLAYALANFDWLQAVIIGVALAPTGPLITLSGLPRAVSALTAGLALPLLVVLINAAAGQSLLATAALPLVGGLALGVALPAVVHLLLRIPGLGIRRQSLAALAIALLLFAIAALTGVNPYLAGFAGGAMVGLLDPTERDASDDLGDQLAGLAGAAAVLIFGVLLSPTLIRNTTGLVWLAVVLFVLLVRPAATAVSLWGAAPRRTALAAGWLLPKPFTSVLLALFVLRTSPIPEGSALYGFLAVCIVGFVVVHAATDVVVPSAGSATWTSSAKPFSTR